VPQISSIFHSCSIDGIPAATPYWKWTRTWYTSQRTVTGITYLALPENYLMPQTQQDMAPGALFFSKTAHPHTYIAKSPHLLRGSCLDWTKRTSNVVTMVARPHASILLPVGKCEKTLSASPLPTTLHQVRERITYVITQINANLLMRIWGEIFYR
jgi:hypothetical protein